MSGKSDQTGCARAGERQQLVSQAAQMYKVVKHEQSKLALPEIPASRYTTASCDDVISLINCANHGENSGTILSRMRLSSDGEAQGGQRNQVCCYAAVLLTWCIGALGALKRLLLFNARCDMNK